MRDSNEISQYHPKVKQLKDIQLQFSSERENYTTIKYHFTIINRTKVKKTDDAK